MMHATNSSAQVLWTDHKAAWRDCQRCVIGKLAACHALARGEVPCDLLFIGEAPGKSEDVIGEPFVGMSGRLLDHWIAAVQTVVPFTYAITNIVACRPTDLAGGPNRKPDGEEIANCRGRLEAFITIAEPRGLVMIGSVAFAQMSQVESLRQIPKVHLLHPAFVLRNGGLQSKYSKGAAKNLERFVRRVRHGKVA